MELENQGLYTELQAGESLTYEVKWYARRLPDNINVYVGSNDLIEFTRNIVN